jgi:hypothetical protein
MNSNITTEILRWVFTAIGALAAIFEPALPYLLICTLLILADCYTAWSLGRRVRKAHPEAVKAETHKFKSSHFARVISTMIKSWVLICLAYLMQRHITDGLPVDMTKIAAGAICFWQLWSILENESSCNGAKWAKMAQRILVDKTTRHLNLDSEDVKEALEGLRKQSGAAECPDDTSDNGVKDGED